MVNHNNAAEKSTTRGYDSAIEVDTPIDATAIVYEGLADAIGEEVKQHDRSATLS